MTAGRAALLSLLALIGALAATAATAEKLIVSVSNPRVTVTPNYAGEELVLFGSVEPDQSNRPLRGPYDMVVTISGPRISVVTWRKQRVLGIWVNADSRQFVSVPAYLAVFSNHPISTLAAPEVLRQQQLGINNFILLQRVAGDYGDVVADDPFRRAFVRVREEQGLYRESADAVTFLTTNLFRASIPLPPEVPVGIYQVEIKLLWRGALIAQTETAFEIVKVGFEQFVAGAAQRNGLGYGLITAAMALLTGWFASVMFRRD